MCYTRESLIYIRTTQQQSVTITFQPMHRIPMEISRTPGTPWNTIPSSRWRRWWRVPKEKRGRRAGMLAQLKRNPSRPPLPSLFISNASSLNNKMDELLLCLTSRLSIKGSCLMIITETLLHPGVPNTAIELVGCSIHCCDSTKEFGNFKEPEGGVVDCLSIQQ